jgi:uncharacterized protein (DUF58 family)
MPQASAQSANGLEKYLDPRVLASIHRLDLRTRLIVEGFISGLHRSPYLGLSVEFAQHREYVPGDDIKHIDWKVYSRSDRYYIKQYEVDTNLRCTFLVDMSESMRYAGAARWRDGLNKYHYGACVASALSLLLLKQQDAVGLTMFDDDVRTSVAPSASPNQIKTIVHHLERCSGDLRAKTWMESICAKMAEKLGRRGMVCVVSDLLVDEDGLFRGLNRLVHRGHDVMVMHVMDEEELSFPFEGNTRFKGMEQAGDLRCDPRALRDGYIESLNEFLARVRRQCAANRIGYALINTADHLGAALARFLVWRVESAHRASAKRR